MSDKERLVIMLDSYQRDRHPESFENGDTKIGLLIKVLIQALKDEDRRKGRKDCTKEKDTEYWKKELERIHPTEYIALLQVLQDDVAMKRNIYKKPLW